MLVVFEHTFGGTLLKINDFIDFGSAPLVYVEVMGCVRLQPRSVSQPSSLCVQLCLRSKGSAKGKLSMEGGYH